MKTVKETAAALSLSAAAVYRFIANGELECYRFGNAIRVSESQLADFIERKRVESESHRFSGGLKHL